MTECRALCKPLTPQPLYDHIMLVDIVVYDQPIARRDRDGLKALTEGLRLQGNDTEKLALFSDGCFPNNNCTATCLDPFLVYLDIYALVNCMAYPWISQLISSGNITVGGLAVANRFNILSNTSNPGEITAIVQIQNNCWNQWITHAHYPFYSRNSPDWSGLCGGDSGSIGTVSADIGGEGVMSMRALSYHEIN